MGLPEIVISFQEKAETAIGRSERGIVAIILKDDTGSFDMKEYSLYEDVEDADFKAESKDYIELAFKGYPNKVIVIRLDEDATDYSEALNMLASKKFNYLAIPSVKEAETAAIVTWVEGQREKNKIFKAVLPNEAGDFEGIINFTTGDIKVKEKTYTTAEYTARLAGIFAGLSLERSATYYVLDEVESITESTDPNADINEGKLILINDGEKIKIGRAVNSLKTLKEGQKEDLKKIKIIESMDLVTEDIRSSFDDEYVGKVSNNYDNKQLFVANVNAYFMALTKMGVLDNAYSNSCGIDAEAHKKLLKKKHVDISSMKDIDIKKLNTGSRVFLSGGLKFVDAMEDLDFNINM